MAARLGKIDSWQSFHYKKYIYATEQRLKYFFKNTYFYFMTNMAKPLNKSFAYQFDFLTGRNRDLSVQNT